MYVIVPFLQTVTKFEYYPIFTVVFSASGDVEELDGTEKNTLKLFKNIILTHEVGMVLLEVGGHNT